MLPRRHRGRHLFSSKNKNKEDKTMPFKSEVQRRWMYANDPELAERWQDKTPKDKRLPFRLHPGKGRKKFRPRQRRGLESALQ
jgi:hypothetical protein